MGEKNTWTVWACPDCGEQVPEPQKASDEPGHYHDPPDDWPDETADPWFDAERVVVAPVEDVERLEAFAERVIELRGGQPGSYQREQFVRALDALAEVLGSSGRPPEED